MAVVSLLSFARYHPDVDLFILSTQLSAESRTLCRTHRITPVEIDLRNSFHTSWNYPPECYYHFKGPELFLELGYERSLYTDGDVYFNRRYPFDLEVPFHLAGASYDTLGGSSAGFKDEEVRRAFPPWKPHVLARSRVNSGVLLYDNRALATLNYFELASKLFDASSRRSLPRKGDDSLLGLMQGLCRELVSHVLPRACNYIGYKFFYDDGAEHHERIFTECIAYHFGRYKPVAYSDKAIPYYHRYFCDKWIEVMINSLSQSEVRRFFPEFYKPRLMMSSQIKFYWYDRHKNFGDWVTPYLVKRVTGRRLSRSVLPRGGLPPIVLSTGSIMRLSGPATIVWGSGIRDRHQDIVPPKVVRSVRGPITRARIMEVGGECPPIYGDPALLLPRIYTPRQPAKRYRLGIVPHVTHYEKVLPLYVDDPETSVIDLRTDDIEGVVDAIAACDAVVSSSLHGIVVANAYGVPVRWIKFAGNLRGDDTKFRDHFAAIGRPMETFIDAMGYRKIPVDALLTDIEPYKMDIDLDRLWEASVFHGGDVSRYVRWICTEEDQLLPAAADGHGETGLGRAG